MRAFLYGEEHDRNDWSCPANPDTDSAVDVRDRLAALAALVHQTDGRLVTNELATAGGGAHEAVGGEADGSAGRDDQETRARVEAVLTLAKLLHA
ncbi:unnamed protein product, partial [Amoebophrya sp. A25]|eukprot:GSA25T00024034001.1